MSLSSRELGSLPLYLKDGHETRYRERHELLSQRAISLAAVESARVRREIGPR
jgi:hypothetical protein